MTDRKGGRIKYGKAKTGTARYLYIKTDSWPRHRWVFHALPGCESLSLISPAPCGIVLSRSNEEKGRGSSKTNNQDRHYIKLCDTPLKRKRIYVNRRQRPSPSRSLSIHTYSYKHKHGHPIIYIYILRNSLDCLCDGIYIYICKDIRTG